MGPTTSPPAAHLVSVTLMFSLFFLGPVYSLLLTTYILLYTPLWPLMILYFAWIYLDRNTCMTTGRRSKWVRNWRLWHHLRDYFPHKLVKTAELPPQHNYLFCLMPHGLITSYAFANLGSDQTGFSQMFPELRLTCHTLTSNFYFPFSREFALAIGCLSVAKECILRQLSSSVGNAVALVVGGSAEAMKSAPGTYRLAIKSRKGFVKLALTTGTCLVPMFGFGEVDIYKVKSFETNSKAYRCQQWLRKRLGWAPVIFQGRGLFHNSFGILPLPTPVTTVVGPPIMVTKIENPREDQVDELHAQFLQATNQLFETHKHLYVANPDTTFLSIED